MGMGGVGASRRSSLPPSGRGPRRPPYADGGAGHFGEQPVIDVTEFYVTPLDLFVWNDRSTSVVSDLKPGGRIGLRIAIVDRDVPYSRQSFPHTVQTFPDIKGSSFSSTVWADGVLVSGQGLAQGQEVSLPSASWARIKASRESRPAERRAP